ncbi:hypothetical protein QQ045_016639 [Rhodiola kirilowii]
MSRLRTREEHEAELPEQPKAAVLKKMKVALEDDVKQQEVEEESCGAVENAAAKMEFLGGWLLPLEMIDEQMSWSMVWLPSWDAEVFADVGWEDDIWGLKSIHEIPKY